MPFTFSQTQLPGVVIVEPATFGDERGFFMESYKRSEFAAAGIDAEFVQENQSLSQRGVLRGLHLQRQPHAQAKLVRVLAGEIFDVAVDIRRDSPTFGRWVAVTLSASNRRMLFVPSWCAHGFCVISDQAQVLYKTTAEYSPSHEFGVRWDDTDLGIPWPIPVDGPTLSARDRGWPPLAQMT